MKQCRRCLVEKPEADFSPYKKSKDGLFSWCKQCNCELQKGRYSRLSPTERTKLNRHHRGVDAQYRSHRKLAIRYQSDPEYRAKIRAQQGGRLYGISADEYVRLRAQPCGVCGIHKVEKGKRGSGMHIDHVHATGRIRGTLCDTCNRGVGMFHDNPVLLRAAAAYLEQHAGLDTAPAIVLKS
jgi:hypothetical protein